jgi:hypothetical protein
MNYREALIRSQADAPSRTGTGRVIRRTPAIFRASAPLIEKHERRRKQKAAWLLVSVLLCRLIKRRTRARSFLIRFRHWRARGWREAR